MIKKQGHWVKYELKPRDFEMRLFTSAQMLQWQKRKVIFASYCDLR